MTNLNLDDAKLRLYLQLSLQLLEQENMDGIKNKWVLERVLKNCY